MVDSRMMESQLCIFGGDLQIWFAVKMTRYTSTDDVKAFSFEKILLIK